MQSLAILFDALQAASCAALVVAAVCCIRQPREGGTRRFLFPFVVAAGALGLLNLYPLGAELFVAHYSGAIYEMTPKAPVEARGIGGIPVGVLVWAGLGAFAGLLPLAGLIPALGRRALLMAVLGFLAMLPWVVHMCRSFVTG